MAEYNIFISWSGSRSHGMATALHDWIQRVIQSAKPFMSSIDIEAGTRSYSAIARQLEESEVGLICVTPENQHESWLNYEAGALSKHLDNSRVAPIILDMRKSDVRKPLGEFDANVITDKKSMLEVATMINSSIDANLDQNRLEESFETYWDRFQAHLSGALDDTVAPQLPTRPNAELLSEILTIVRALSNQITLVESRLSPFNSDPSNLDFTTYLKRAKIFELLKRLPQTERKTWSPEVITAVRMATSVPHNAWTPGLIDALNDLLERELPSIGQTNESQLEDSEEAN